jgi:hypothetical protein
MALENNQIENPNTNNDEISLKDLIFKIKDWLIFLKSKWKIIFLAGIIGGLIGLTFAILEKPTYKAVLTFALEEDRGSGGGGLSGLSSSFGIEIGASGGLFSSSNLAELMKSRLLVEKVLLKPIKINGKIISLVEYYIEINELRDSWNKNENLKNIQFLPEADPNSFTIQQDSILQKIHQKLIEKDNLSIMQKDKKATILSIEVVSNNEIFSKFFCENLAKETSSFYIDTKSKKSRINVDILQKQVDSIKYSLNGAILGAASESDNVYNLNPALNKKGTETKKRQIDVQANTSILTNLVLQLELAKITLRKETPLIQLIDQPKFPLIKDKFGKTKSMLLGGFLFVLFSILYFTFFRMY